MKIAPYNWAICPFAHLPHLALVCPSIRPSLSSAMSTSNLGICAPITFSARCPSFKAILYLLATRLRPIIFPKSRVSTGPSACITQTWPNTNTGYRQRSTEDGAVTCSCTAIHIHNLGRHKLIEFSPQVFVQVTRLIRANRRLDSLQNPRANCNESLLAQG